MHFYDWVLIWDNLCCLFSNKVFECFCFNRVSWWCSMMCGTVRIHFHSVSRVLLWSLLICFWCHQSPLWPRDSTLQVRLFVLSVCLCVWVFWSVMICLFILELVSQFSILLHSAACLSWMWFCRFQPCRSLPSLMEKFCQFIVFVRLVN